MTAQWPQGPKRDKTTKGDKTTKETQWPQGDKTTKETQWPLGYRIPSGGQIDWPLEALEVPKVPQKEEPKG